MTWVQVAGPRRTMTPTWARRARRTMSWQWVGRRGMCRGLGGADLRRLVDGDVGLFLALRPSHHVERHELDGTRSGPVNVLCFPDADDEAEMVQLQDLRVRLLHPLALLLGPDIVPKVSHVAQVGPERSEGVLHRVVL